ncbi:MAG: tetratricopeptide repeat protein, partial [Burkholderiales bacterium]
MNQEQCHLLAEATAHRAAGRAAEAEQSLRGFLDANPAHPAASHDLGLMLCEAGRVGEALPLLRAAVHGMPEVQAFWLDYLDALIAAGDHGGAVAALAQARARGGGGPALDAIESRLPAPSTPTGREMQEVVLVFQRGHVRNAVQLAEGLTARYPRHPFGWRALGSLLALQGQHRDAVEPLRRTVELAPDDAEALCNLGMALHEIGELPQAEDSLRQAIAMKPDLVEAHHNLGRLLLERGRLAEAEPCLRRALELKPDLAAALNTLAAVLLRSGRAAEAEGHLQRALSLQPGMRAAQVNLAAAQLALSRFELAEETLRRLLASDPDNAEALLQLAQVLARAGRPLEAEDCLSRALGLRADHASAWATAARVHRQLGRVSTAESQLRRALEIDPGHGEALNALSLVLIESRRYEEAEQHLRELLRIDPENVVALGNLGVVLGAVGRLLEAEQSLRRALVLRPDYAPAQGELAEVFLARGDPDQAEQALRRALEIEPAAPRVLSNLLMVRNYSERQTAAGALEEARTYGRLVSAAARPFPAWAHGAAEERLRIGLVSADLREHAVSYFLESVLPHLGHWGIEVYGYPTVGFADRTTERLRAQCAGWHYLHGDDDATAARRIHGHGVDILIDLSGHTGENRLPIFAFKPAPLQVSWLGYFATTGLPQIDYLLADPVSVPPEHDSHFSESVWRLPHTRLCFTPPEEEVVVGPLPASRQGFLTLGSFLNQAKINDSVLALWARVLAAL